MTDPQQARATRYTASKSHALYSRVAWRIVPFLILLYLVAFLDRVNVSFASLNMNRDLGMSESAFGLAAGIFFLGYLLFAVPSNLLLTRFGPQRWIGFIMVTWGLLSCGTAFVPGPRSYIFLRFLIGAAEAGFYPGVILYLTAWFPSSKRSGVMALFNLSIPLASVVGAPISAAILRIGDGYGLHSWQWLFLLEGLPSILLGCVTPRLLAGNPQQATWLSLEDRTELSEALNEDQTAAVAIKTGRLSLDEAYRPPLYWLRRLALPGSIYFSLMMALYALSFWVPRILASRGVPLTALGWVTAIPASAGALSMVVWGRYADADCRRLHLIAPMCTAVAGFSVVAFSSSRAVSVIGVSLATLGVLASMPVFWAMLSRQFEATDAALAIASVNSVGNVGGFVSPYLVGWLLQQTGRYEAGLLVVAGALTFGIVQVIRFARLLPKANTVADAVAGGLLPTKKETR